MSYVKDKEKQRAYNRKWRESHPNYLKEWRRKHPNYFPNRFQNAKLSVLTHYGHGEAKCMRCGFSDIRALSIDHINGNGHRHKKSINRYGSTFYLWLIQNNYPLGFQTLCFNCQLIKRFENHENRK